MFQHRIDPEGFLQRSHFHCKSTVVGQIAIGDDPMRSTQGRHLLSYEYRFVRGVRTTYILVDAESMCKSLTFSKCITQVQEKTRIESGGGVQISISRQEEINLSLITPGYSVQTVV